MKSRPLGILAAFLICLAAIHTHAAPPGKTQNLTSPDQVPEGLAKSDWSSIRAAYEAGRHAFQPTATGWQARNPGQQWTTKFDGRGFLAEPRDGAWTWGLELKSYGFGDKQRAIGGTPAVKAEGQRLTYQWDATVQEWWVNDARGLEHGFTVKERPEENRNGKAESRESLSFTLATRGTLRPTITPDAQGVLFQDATGATVINYTGLKVWDADGQVLASRFEAAGENGVRLLVDESDARYPLTIDPVAQQAYLKLAPDGALQAGDSFGYSVAVSGDTVVVGAPTEDSSTTGVNSTPDESAADSGAAYVFVRSAGGWTQQAYLKPAAVGTTQAGDQFGISVAVSGDTVVVGAYGEDSSTLGVNSTPNESAPDSGAAYVFVRTAGVWTQQAYLKPAAVGTSQAGDQFGISVAVSGDTVVVGAPYEASSTSGVNSTPDESAPNSGAAYVFVRSAGVWTQQAYLKPAAVGTTQAGDYFGYSVAVSGDTVVVGAVLEDSSTTGVNSTPNESAAQSGAAYVFTVPKIIVAQPAGTALSSGASIIGYGGVALGSSSAVKTFTIRNTGPGALALTSVGVTGGNAGDFTVNTTGMLTSVPASGSTTFTVTCTPAAAGSRTTTLRILNNDIYDGTFAITLTGTGLSFTIDTDGDGLNDASEFNMAALGFDWQVAQPALVNTLFANANGANLYTPAQVQALNVGTPLLQKNPTNGLFTLTIGVEKSTTLLPGSFIPFPMNTPGFTTTINGAGKLEFQFTVPDNAAFFRLQAQ